jgi:hypothetical protein
MSDLVRIGRAAALVSVLVVGFGAVSAPASTARHGSGASVGPHLK